MLPVYDDICRSVESVEKGETKDYENLKQGIEMIKSKFWKVLQEEGITEINSFGQPFNVDTSTAMLQVERENTEPNTVVEVIEKGYKLKDRVIIFEKVIVSK
ncbi:MAG: Molecular chaperone GrpE [Chlorobi bacterium OLB4]|nr:MAG: Molecular chaperone GrpE [Chlorobi bacterium OLB4]